MKKIRNILSLFIVVVLSLLIIKPTEANALEKESSYINIYHDITNFEIADLSFSYISFNNYAYDSTKAFGLSGVVTNKNNETVDYISTVYYYDQNYNLVAKVSNSKTAVTGISDFNQMSNLDILNGYNVSDIYYYILKIEVIDDSSSEYPVSKPSENSLYNSYDYVIDKYDINIIVNENNTLDITETITAYFNEEKHGIYRTIPLKNIVERLDGTISKNRCQITNVNVDNEYSTSRENGNYKIKIGSKYQTYTGSQTYVIKYTYNLGKDYNKDYDELYYNIIGDDWDTVIGNITFTITMPKSFDSSKLGFSSGVFGSTNNENISYNVIDNKISGSYNGVLNENEALTVRCVLDEGYFVNAGLEFNFFEYIPFLIPIIFLVIAIFLWFIFGRDDKVIDTVEFYPPEGLNSLDVGFMYKGKAENKDVTSLLVYLANKGYIKIYNKNIDLDKKNEEKESNVDKKIAELQKKIEEESSINPKSEKIKYYTNMLAVYQNDEKAIKKITNKKSTNNDYIIVKVKDYDGNDENERMFMEGLFKNDRTEVTQNMLYNKFYVTNNKILKNVNSKENKHKIFEKSSTNKSIIIILMIIASILLITIPPVINYGDPSLIMIALIFPGLAIFLVFTVIFNNKNYDTNLWSKIFIFIWGIGFGGIPWAICVLPGLLQDPLYFVGYFIGLLNVIGLLVCYKYLPKRTKYGNEILGKLNGFKRFLETAEKDKLEALVMENPTYFYDILPFTYVFNISDKWIKKFESISLREPYWYEGVNSFNILDFGDFIDHTMSSAESAMKSTPSSSYSGGGSSGGGFSGGGSGGGGGSSW